MAQLQGLAGSSNSVIVVEHKLRVVVASQDNRTAPCLRRHLAPGKLFSSVVMAFNETGE